MSLTFVCPKCTKSYSRKDSLAKHAKKGKCENKANEVIEWHCEYCPKLFLIKSSYLRHVKSHRGKLQMEISKQEYEELFEESSDDEEFEGFQEEQEEEKEELILPTNMKFEPSVTV